MTDNPRAPTGPVMIGNMLFRPMPEEWKAARERERRARPAVHPNQGAEASASDNVIEAAFGGDAARQPKSEAEPKRPSFTDDDLRDLMADVAHKLLGEPNKALSSKRDWRYGTRGSLSIDPVAGAWRDYETKEKGGTLDLIVREARLADRAAAVDWLWREGFRPQRGRQTNKAHSERKKREKSDDERVRGDRYLGRKPAVTYPYTDAEGELLYEAVRFEPKDFRPRQPDGNGSWFWDLQGIGVDKQVPYRLPELNEAIAAEHDIYICEGEKAADAGRAVDLVCTCGQGGVGNTNAWDALRQYLVGAKRVVVIADNDPQATDGAGKPRFHKDGSPVLPGQDHARAVAAKLVGVAEQVCLLDLGAAWPDCPLKGDLYDYLECHTREEFDVLADAAPEFEPTDEPIGEPGAARDDVAPQTEKNTDLGNARRLVRLHGDDLRYVHAWHSWFVWTDGHWRRDVDQAVVRRAKATVEAMFEEARQINDDSRRTALRTWALRSQEAKRLAAMVSLAQSEIEVVLPVTKMDADPYLLGVPNGVVDLRTGTFREARREDYVTKIAGAPYDARARCPNWEAFLKEVLPDDVVAYLQRAVGYVLTGLTVEEVLFVLYGTGANGKSTFRETLFALLGEYAVGADASLLITPKHGGGATPDLARLYGRRLVTVNETEASDKLNESRVKFMTSHDIITARNLYEGFFDFAPTHKAFLTTNHKPIVRGTDEGIWRRIPLLPFVETIPAEKRDVHFRAKKLLPELSGILNWALAGLRAYQQQGLNPPEAVTAATKEYREDMDIIGQWIDERCVRDFFAETSSAQLHEDYKEWAEDEVGFMLSKVTFGRALAERGFKKIRVNRSKGFRGLKLRWQ
jgi:putative DNA primase/helicase